MHALHVGGTTATQKKWDFLYFLYCKIDRVHLLPSGVPGPNAKSDSRVNRS